MSPKNYHSNMKRLIQIAAIASFAIITFSQKAFSQSIVQGSIPGNNVSLVQGAAGQTANLTEWNINGGSALGSISKTGVATFSGLSLSSALPVGSGGTGLNGTPGNGQVIIGNGSGFVLANITQGSGITITNGAGSITVALTTPVSVANGGTGAGAFTQGSVVFAGASGVYSQNNAKLFWDNTNTRLGIGTIIPAFLLDVNGDASFNGVKVGRGGGSLLGNTAVGNSSLASTTTGGKNTATGFNSLKNNITGSDNSAFGFSSLVNSTSGTDNTAVGYNALSTNTTGTFNTAIGSQAFANPGTLTNATAIGALAEVTASNCLVLGSINGVNGAGASTSVVIGATSPEAASIFETNVSAGEYFVPDYGVSANEVILGVYNTFSNAGPQLRFSNTGSTYTDIGQDGSGNGNFVVEQNDAAKLTITPSGNVGIGTTPNAKLDVAGNVKIADGTQSVGKVLTSDANGNASWQIPQTAVAYGLIGPSGGHDGTYGIASVTHVSIGNYSITCSATLLGIASVVCTMWDTNFYGFISYFQSGSNTISVRVRNASGADADQNFSIVVFGR